MRPGASQIIRKTLAATASPGRGPEALRTAEITASCGCPNIILSTVVNISSEGKGLSKTLLLH